MVDPFGCGNVCRSWLCHPCLRQVLPQSSRFIAPQPIHLTICGLWWKPLEGNRWPRGHRDLFIPGMWWRTANQEDLCAKNGSFPHVWARGPYANWGCGSMGQRMDLSDHDTNTSFANLEEGWGDQPKDSPNTMPVLVTLRPSIMHGSKPQARCWHSTPIS